MESLLQQVRDLPRRARSLSARVRWLLLGGAAAIVTVAVLIPSYGAREAYQYVFTNLTTEDSSEAAAILKTAQIPFRIEAGGAALAVPASKVYEARLLLATAGLPRGGEVGFELFDRGDIGVSEFTHKINLRRAIEGELARTIGRLGPVRSARVHITLAEKGLFQDQNHLASAAVVLTLHPGRTLSERELSGIRHLVSSAVPALPPDHVTVVDGRGAVLAAKGEAADDAMAFQRKTERDLEDRIVGLLEPVVGHGAVVARVSASFDASLIESSAEVIDPDSAALSSERKMTQSQSSSATGAGMGGVAGAAANQALLSAMDAPTSSERSSSATQEESRSWQMSKTTTTTVTRVPRLKRLSVAVLVDGKGGKPLPDPEVARLGELVKRAVGFDAARGDQLQIQSVLFSRSAEEAAPPAGPATTAAALDRSSLAQKYMVPAAGVLLFAGLVVAFARRRAPPTVPPQTGVRTAELEAALAEVPADLQLKDRAPGVPPDPNLAIRDRVRELAQRDPTRAAHLLRAWIAADAEHEVKDG